MVFSSDSDRNDCWLSVAPTVTQTSIYTFPNDVFCLFCARKYIIWIRHSSPFYSFLFTVSQCAKLCVLHIEPLLAIGFPLSISLFVPISIVLHSNESLTRVTLNLWQNSRISHAKAKDLSRSNDEMLCSSRSRKIRTENKWNTSNWRLFVIFGGR